MFYSPKTFKICVFLLVLFTPFVREVNACEAPNAERAETFDREAKRVIENDDTSQLEVLKDILQNFQNALNCSEANIESEKDYWIRYNTALTHERIASHYLFNSESSLDHVDMIVSHANQGMNIAENAYQETWRQNSEYGDIHLKTLLTFGRSLDLMMSALEPDSAILRDDQARRYITEFIDGDDAIDKVRAKYLLLRGISASQKCSGNLFFDRDLSTIYCDEAIDMFIHGLDFRNRAGRILDRDSFWDYFIGKYYEHLGGTFLFYFTELVGSPDVGFAAMDCLNQARARLANVAPHFSPENADEVLQGVDEKLSSVEYILVYEKHYADVDLTPLHPVVRIAVCNN